MFLANRWRPNKPFALGVRVRPSTEDQQNGFEYESSGGQSNGRREPRWKRAPQAEVDGTTYTDGSLVWTARHLTLTSYHDRIFNSTWTVPAGVTGSAEVAVLVPGLQETQIAIEGGTPGETYDIVNQITTDLDRRYHGILRLTIE
jgi:hypothetical protein